MARIEGLQCGDELQGQQPEQWEHPLVQKLLGDSGGPPDVLDVIMLTGFLGRGPDPNHKILYREADLSEWYIIPATMILCEYRSKVDGDELGKDVVLLRRGAPGTGRWQFP